MERPYGFGVLLISLCFPVSVGAQVIISEIMYDLESGSDTGREWVEVFNAGSSSVKLVDWKLSEADTNHGIGAFSGGETLGSGAYAILADNPTKFLADWPGFSGLLFDSAFSLSNTGETLAIYTPSPEFAVSDSVAYQSAWGAAGDGTVLQRSSADAVTFSAGAPTPGSGALVGSASGSPAEGTQPASSPPALSSSGSSAPVPSYVPALEPELFAYAGKDRDAIAGADVAFEGVAYDKEGKSIDPLTVRYLWTFGDGGSANGHTVLHRFSEPGRYAIILDIAKAVNAASHRVVVNVHPVSITLSLRSNSIVLTNTSGRELDLSGWHLRSGASTFTLPRNSLLLVGASVPFAYDITRLAASPDAVLLYPNGVVAVGVHSLPASVPNAPATAPRVNTPRVPAASVPETESEINATEAVEEPPSAQALLASSAVAEPAGRSHWWWLGALALGGAVATGVVLSRRTALGEWNIIEEK